DVESRPWVSNLAGQIGLAHAVAQKTRRGDRSVEIGFVDPVALIGRPVLLVDDIVSSGGTLIACAKALTAAGARTIDAIITHALYPPAMAADFADAGIRSIRSTSSVPHASNAIPLDDILAEALRSETNNRLPERSK